VEIDTLQHTRERRSVIWLKGGAASLPFSPDLNHLEEDFSKIKGFP
jgi:hypothetical protein